MGSEDEKEKILGDIEKTGFPLEIEVTSILEEDGWLVYNQEGYLDPDENKLRTIDILGFKVRDFPDALIYKRLHYALVVECKKSEKPWVFYTREKKGVRTFDSLMAWHIIKEESEPPLHPLHIEKFVDCLHYYMPNFGTFASISYEPFTGGKGQSIFEAVNQVVKALHYHRVKRGMLKTAKTHLVSIIYPVIVFEGHLFELRSHEKKITLHPSDYIQYAVSYKSPSISDFFLVDLVKVNFLKNYLKMLDGEMESLGEKIASLDYPSAPPSENRTKF